MSFASDIGRSIALGPLRPMTDKETGLLASLIFTCNEPEQSQIEFYKNCLNSSMILKIMDSRFRLHLGEDVKFSPPFMIWLSTLAGGSPGMAVLMVAFLAFLRSENSNLTFSSCVERYFAVGIPTAENLSAAWDRQKIDGANGLDMAESWK